MTISCIIIEDEPLALERARDYVGKVHYLNLVAAFENSADAMAYLKKNKVDLIFLDINLGELTGIDLLESTIPSGEIIMTTAYPDYAIKGFDLNVTDYLLKPYTFERFQQAVDKAFKNLSAKNALPDKKFIFVKTEYRLEKILLNEILFIEGMRDYRRIHTSDKKIMTLQTFKDFEQEIPQKAVCRVHKSFMVSLEKIDSVERDRIKIKDVYIPISETYKKSFFDLIEQSQK